MQALEILTGTQRSDDYPYGRLRCSITFAVEFKPKKGFRYVTQTVNPKNGRVNKPKRGVYSHVMCLYREEESGHVKPWSLNIHGHDGIATLIDFLKVNDVTFTAEESRWIYTTVIANIRIGARYTRIAEGKGDEFFAATRYTEIVALFKANAPINDLTTVGHDVEAINACKA